MSFVKVIFNLRKLTVCKHKFIDGTVGHPCVFCAEVIIVYRIYAYLNQTITVKITHYMSYIVGIFFAAHRSILNPGKVVFGIPQSIAGK